MIEPNEHTQPSTDDDTSLEEVRAKLRQLDHLVHKVWDDRISDAAESAGVAGRVDKLEGGFESVWSLLTRVHVDVADLTRALNTHYAESHHCHASAHAFAPESGDQR